MTKEQIAEIIKYCTREAAERDAALVRAYETAGEAMACTLPGQDAHGWLRRLRDDIDESLGGAITKACIAAADGDADEAEKNAAQDAEVRELVEALREVEKHHEAINDARGRPQEQSKTLAIVRTALAKFKEPA